MQSFLKFMYMSKTLHGKTQIPILLNETILPFYNGLEQKEKWFSDRKKGLLTFSTHSFTASYTYALLVLTLKQKGHRVGIFQKGNYSKKGTFFQKRNTILKRVIFFSKAEHYSKKNTFFQKRNTCTLFTKNIIITKDVWPWTQNGRIRIN